MVLIVRFAADRQPETRLFSVARTRVAVVRLGFSEAGPDELRRMQGEFDPWPSAAAVSTESTLEESLRAATEAIDRSVQRLLR